jgi:hypothetical protein
LAGTTLPCLIDVASGQRQYVRPFPPQAFDRPVYLTLCTLLI